MGRINPSYGKEVKPMEKDLKKAALPDEGIAAVNGGMSGLEAIEALDLTGLFDKPLRAAREAMALTSESARTFFEREMRKIGRNDEQ